MKSIQVLITLACVGLAVSQQMFDCAKGCVQCLSSKGCISCFNSKMVPKWNFADEERLTLGQQVPSKWDCAPQDPNDNCLLYTQGANPGQVDCTMCKSGFALDMQKKICIRSTISNCDTGIFSGVDQCYSCINSTYPTPNYSSCVSIPSPPVG